MDKESRRGIFFGIIGVLTLLIAIVGAAFAYFSINVKSRDDALTVKAAQVQIVYNDGDSIAIDEIIPSTKAIALTTVSRATSGSGYTTCVDDNGYKVCGFYDFTLTNKGNVPVTVEAIVSPSELKADADGVVPNKFSNLKFIMSEVNNDGTENPKFEGAISYSNFSLLGTTADNNNKTMEIPGKTTKKYRLFIWLNEAGESNDIEQGAQFKGTVKINVIGAMNGTVTGSAN